MRKTESNKKCRNCAMWRPHVVYPFIGLCVKHGKLTGDDDSCDYFMEIQVNSQDFYWVPEIRSRVFGEEAKLLKREGFKIYLGAYVDPDVREEIYGGF